MSGEEKQGVLSAGLRQVLRALSAGRAAQVFLAEDAQEHIRRQVVSAALAAEVPVENVPTMQELGHMCRLPVACAAAVRLKV